MLCGDHPHSCICLCVNTRRNQRALPTDQHRHRAQRARICAHLHCSVPAKKRGEQVTRIAIAYRNLHTDCDDIQALAHVETQEGAVCLLVAYELVHLRRCRYGVHEVPRDTVTAMRAQRCAVECHDPREACRIVDPRERADEWGQGQHRVVSVE